MLNQIVLVGRLVSDPEIKETESGKKVSNITLAVNRSFKNEEGIYETDFIDCILWNGIATNTSEYCKKGDLVGVKGRVQSTIVSDDSKSIDESKKNELQIVAEKVTFLSKLYNRSRWPATFLSSKNKESND